MKTLFEKRANINLKNNNDDTPLHLAVLADKDKSTEFLLKNKARTNIKNKDGKTAKDLSAGKGKEINNNIIYQLNFNFLSL